MPSIYATSPSLNVKFQPFVDNNIGYRREMSSQVSQDYGNSSSMHSAKRTPAVC
jgi:hypothetical protein